MLILADRVLRQRQHGFSYQHNLTFWTDNISPHPAVPKSKQLAALVGKGNDLFDYNKEDAVALVPGMNTLEGATSERVCTCFPPEPLGYLHVGQAKAVLLSNTVYA